MKELNQDDMKIIPLYCAQYELHTFVQKPNFTLESELHASFVSHYHIAHAHSSAGVSWTRGHFPTLNMVLFMCLQAEYCHPMFVLVSRAHNTY